MLLMFSIQSFPTYTGTIVFMCITIMKKRKIANSRILKKIGENIMKHLVKNIVSQQALNTVSICDKHTIVKNNVL